MRKKFLAGILSLFFSISVNAADYSQLIIFGDSLSDSGNLYAISNYPPLPYNQRATNELVWPEYLSPKIGLEYVAENNNAMIGALTNSENNVSSTVNMTLLGVQQQIDDYLQSNPILDEKALYIVWGGANNLLNIEENMSTLAVAAIINEAVNDISSHVSKLANAGAKNIVVIDLPNLGLVPRVNVQGETSVAAAKQLTDAYNNFLYERINNLSFRVHIFKADNVLNMLIANPTAYSISNFFDACLDINSLSLCDNPDSYLFWDDLHMTAAGHKIFAEAVFDMVRQARYDSLTQTLKLPALNIDEATGPLYDVSLKLDTDSGYFVLDSAEVVDSEQRLAAHASFDSQNGVLKVKSVYMTDGQGNESIVDATFNLEPGGNYRFSFQGIDSQH